MEDESIDENLKNIFSEGFEDKEAAEKTLKEALRKIEENKPIDLFKPSEEWIEGNRISRVFSKKVKFERYPTFEEDLINLRQKWYGTDGEVLVQHMIDSLIIFVHNKDNLRGEKIKFKKLEELKQTNGNR